MPLKNKNDGVIFKFTRNNFKEILMKSLRLATKKIGPV